MLTAKEEELQLAPNIIVNRLACFTETGKKYQFHSRIKLKEKQILVIKVMSLSTLANPM